MELYTAIDAEDRRRRAGRFRGASTSDGIQSGYPDEKGAAAIIIRDVNPFMSGETGKSSDRKVDYFTKMHAQTPSERTERKPL
jgi:hypothetical protein